VNRSRTSPCMADQPAPRQSGVAILTGMMMALILLAPMILWFGIRDLDGRTPPSCHASSVVAHLRAVTTAGVDMADTAAIRQIQTMGLDTRLGHRVCSARIGDGAGVRTVKFAVRYSASGAVQVEVVNP
jgi:hypothetical protein